MSPLPRFIRKNLKFSFYLKEHTLKPYPNYPGVYYIVRRKGKKRLNIRRLPHYRNNLTNWEYWDAIINNQDDALYKTEERRIQAQSKLYHYQPGSVIDLKERQQYAVQRARGRILDVGCFDGKTLCRLLELGRECEGVDFGDLYLEAARNNFQAAGGDAGKIAKGLFQQLPYKEATFDTVISQETLEHFYFPDILVAEIARVLKKGGIFIGSTPLLNRIDSETHLIFYESAGLRALLEPLFTIDDLQEIKDLPGDGHPKLIVWQASRK